MESWRDVGSSILRNEKCVAEVIPTVGSGSHGILVGCWKQHFEERKMRSRSNPDLSVGIRLNRKIDKEPWYGEPLIKIMRKLKNAELERLNLEEFRQVEKTPIILVLDNIRSLNNIGSVFRTADAFLVEKIYLCGITASPPHKDIHKTALGATESVSWEYRKDTLPLILELKPAHYCISVEQTEKAVSLNRFYPDPGLKYVLVFGNEVKGVAQEVVNACHAALEIPQFGTKHSLNIAVSAGVVVWDLWSKFEALGERNEKP